VGSSSNLADLRELFSSGVHASEVLLLVLTDGLLTRPWVRHCFSILRSPGLLPRRWLVP
jgi:hypothetical protein